jgi:recombination protein RecT
MEQTKALTTTQQVKNLFNVPTIREQFANALKENASLFQASIIELVSNDENLAKCDPKSIITGALTLATLRIPLNKSLGFAYLVHYKGQCQPQIGYKGLVQLAQRTGLYECINYGEVYEGELKSIDRLSGEIDISGERTGDNVIGYFAYFRTKYGFAKSVYWSKEKVIAHAKRFSQSYRKNFGPWVSDFDAMAMKTVLKFNLGHFGPMTIDIADSIAKVEANDLPEDAFDIEIEATPDPLKAMAEAVTAKEVVVEIPFTEPPISREELLAKADPTRIKDLVAQLGPVAEWTDAGWDILAGQ